MVKGMSIEAMRSYSISPQIYPYTANQLFLKGLHTLFFISQAGVCRTPSTPMIRLLLEFTFALQKFPSYRFFFYVILLCVVLCVCFLVVRMFS